MRKLRLKNYLDQEMQGLVNGDLITLELCCSPTLPLPQLIPSPRDFQTHIQKKHSNQFSASSSSLQCYRGLGALSSPRRTMPRRGLAHQVPAQVKFLHNGGITLLQVPQMQTSHTARCPCRNMAAGYWLNKLTGAQSCWFCTRTDCNTGNDASPHRPAGQQMHTSAMRL